VSYSILYPVSYVVVVCPYDMYQCDDGQCVMAWPCDGTNECADGSDENNCSTLHFIQGCGDVIIITVSMVVAMTPCCGDRKHYHYVRFHIASQ